MRESLAGTKAGVEGGKSERPARNDSAFAEGIERATKRAFREATLTALRTARSGFPDPTAVRAVSTLLW